MPAVIPFLSTGDNYPSDNSAGQPIIGPLQQIANITFQVQGTNNVYFQVARQNKDGSVTWDETDLPAVPGSGGFSGKAYGIKFKSATPGQPATISAIAFFNDDAVPFQAVNQGSSSGGGSGTIQDITSSSLTVTNPTGPTTDIEAVNFIEKFNGGLETVDTISGAGSSQTLNLANGNVFDITLNSASCALTMAGATAGVMCSCSLILRQDSSGSRQVNWTNSITWLSGIAPILHTSPNAIDVIELFSDDGGTTWIGFQTSQPTSFASQQIPTNQGTTSSSYTDLATVGPSATINIGASGTAIVGWNSQGINSGSWGRVSVKLSGANTLIASDVWSIGDFINGSNIQLGTVFPFTGLSPGATTFTMQYKSGGGTSNFQNRSIWALAL